MGWFFSEPCKHKWEKTVDKLLPSPLENATSTGLSVGTKGINIAFFNVVHVLVLTCTECGKVDKTVTSNLP